MTTPETTSVLDRWLSRLDSTGALTARDRHALFRAAAGLRAFEPQEVLFARGAASTAAFVVVEGLVARRKETALGRHQITSIFLPGDLIDGAAGMRQIADHDLIALSSGVAAVIPELVLKDLDSKEGLDGVLRRAAAYEAALSREWVVNIGAREAGPRVAHLLCELVWRLRRAGLAHDHACDLPLRQQDIADATGISAVHANRVLQRLRRGGLIRLAGDRLEICDTARLEEYAEFEPDYLEAAAALQAPAPRGAATS